MLAKAFLLFWSRFFNNHRELTLLNAKKAFQAAGWNITGDRRGGVSFFLQPEKGSWIAICVTSRLTNLVLTDAMSWKQEFKAEVAILTDTPAPVEFEQQAMDRGVAILQWPDIDLSDNKIEAIRKARAHVVTLAKTSRRAKLPFTEASLSRPLTAGERETGFFFATDNVSCWFEDRGSAEVLITFAPAGSDPSSGSRWGAPYGFGNACSCFGFESSALNWFPADDMRQCLAAVEAKLSAQASVRVLLGAGQGGYAAIRYSRQLKATTVVAFSPVFSIDPDILLDMRLSESYKSSLNSGMNITDEDVFGKLLVFYDPYDISDRLQITRLSGLPDVISVKLPFAGNGCGYLAHNPDAVRQVLLALSRNEAKNVRQIGLSYRHTNPQRAFLMGLYASDYRPASGLSIFLRYSKLQPGPQWMHLCFRLAVCGLGNPVFEWVKRNADDNPDNAEAQAVVALVAQRIFERDVAFDYIGRALELQPRNIKFQHIRSEITFMDTAVSPAPK